MELEITPVFPQGLGEVNLDMIEYNIVGTDVAIIEDEELKVSNKNSQNPAVTIEINGRDSSIAFDTDCNRRYLVFQFKTLKRYVTLGLVVIDNTGKERMFEMSNKNSVVTIENSRCSMPLEVALDGWNYLCIEPDELLENSFGTATSTVKEVSVHGTCRLAKIFFQSKKYSDVELPKFLRLVNPN